jgi:hypothetical protein
MQVLRRLLLLASLAVLLVPCARATGTAPENGMLRIVLEHHWVVEVSGHRFGLIQFDTPMTVVLLGGIDFDVPAPAFVVLAPLLTLPLLAVIGVVARNRRRRFEFC